MTPIKKVINETIGMAPTPAAIASWTARCAMRPRFKGEDKQQPQGLAADLSQTAHVCHASLGCAAHLCNPLHHAVPNASCSV